MNLGRYNSPLLNRNSSSNSNPELAFQYHPKKKLWIINPYLSLSFPGVLLDLVSLNNFDEHGNHSLNLLHMPINNIYWLARCIQIFFCHEHLAAATKWTLSLSWISSKLTHGLRLESLSTLLRTAIYKPLPNLLHNEVWSHILDSGFFRFWVLDPPWNFFILRYNKFSSWIFKSLWRLSA